MGVYSGPNVTTSGLIAAIDANNRKCTIWAAPKGLINTDAWADGQTGSVTGYDANQTTTTENARVLATDPWGNTSVVWETRASGDGNNDGGWNTSWYNVDRTKLYRFSVWMRRTSSTTGGTFYFGLYGTGGTGGVARLDTGATETNPYWDCSSPSLYTQNQWYLFVGHCYPFGTTFTGRHPDSGYYHTNGTKSAWNGCNIGNDVKMLSDTTQLLHRAYHFYCADSTTRLQFAYPRIDLCDGTEPTIGELLNGRGKIMRNIVGSSFNFTMSKQGSSIGQSANAAVTAKIYTLDGTLGSIITTSDLNLASGQYTIIGVSRFTGGTNGRIISALNNNWLLGHWSGSTENYYAEGWVTNAGTGPLDTNWRVLAATGDTTSDSYKIYVNGVNTFSNNGGSAGPNNFAIGSYAGTNEPSNGEFAVLYVYNRVLSDAEIQQNFNSLRGRFGI